jgi:hypothetical protein
MLKFVFKACVYYAVGSAVAHALKATFEGSEDEIDVR